MESDWLLASYDRIPRHVFMTCAYFMFPGGVVLNAGGTRKHWDPIFSSASPDQDEKELVEGAASYSSTRTPMTEHIKKQENLTYGCYRGLLRT